MSGCTFNGPAWPFGKDWPASALPPPSLTIEIAAMELEVLIEHHDAFGKEAHARHNHEAELFHKARASYLRQRLGAIAPHRLTPERMGHA